MYQQFKEIDKTTMYFEVVFEVKKNSYKIALLTFCKETKKLLKQELLKQFNKGGECVGHDNLKQKLNKKQVQEFKKYLEL